MNMNINKGQAEIQNEQCLYRLILTKRELEALKSALRIEYTGLTELLKEDPDWGIERALVGSVLNKTQQLLGELK